MKHRVFTILVFLVLGAIVNVAVAWGITLSHGSLQELTQMSLPVLGRPRRAMTLVEQQWYRVKERQGFLGPGLSEKGREWVRDGPTVADEQGIGWQKTAYVEVLHEKSTMRLPNGEQVQAVGTGYRWSGLSRFESGWPTRTLFIVFTPALARQDSGWGLPTCWGLFPKLQGYGVPVDPTWPGFAINALFYAAILWGIFAAPFALRRLRGGRRIRRGLCPACAYPIGDSQVCTECGKPVRSARPRV